MSHRPQPLLAGQWDMSDASAQAGVAPRFKVLHQVVLPVASYAIDEDARHSQRMRKCIDQGGMPLLAISVSHTMSPHTALRVPGTRRLQPTGWAALRSLFR